MSLEDNKALVQRFIDEVMNAGNTAAIADLCVPDSMFAGGIEGQIKAMKTAFPDNHVTIDDIVAEDNKVALRVTIRGTNSGLMLGFAAFGRLETPVPPTGHSVMVNGMYIFTISDDRIVSYSTEFDQIGVLRQLGWTFSPPENA